MEQPIILPSDGPPADREALLRLLVEIARNILIRRQQADAEEKKAA